MEGEGVCVCGWVRVSTYMYTHPCLFGRELLLTSGSDEEKAAMLEKTSGAPLPRARKVTPATSYVSFSCELCANVRRKKRGVSTGGKGAVGSRSIRVTGRERMYDTRTDLIAERGERGGEVGVGRVAH